MIIKKGGKAEKSSKKENQSEAEGNAFRQTERKCRWREKRKYFSL